MKKPPAYWNTAKKKLSKKDLILKKVIKKFNKGFLTTRKDPFFSLCRTIVGQQISTKAADSIWLKFEKKCKKKIIPKNVLKLSSRTLRSVGLSRQKISYLKNIAKTRERYFRGVVKVTSASLYDCVKSKLATLPSKPIKIKKIKS